MIWWLWRVLAHSIALFQGDGTATSVLFVLDLLRLSTVLFAENAPTRAFAFFEAS
jgi:hypothetical protein